MDNNRRTAFEVLLDVEKHQAYSNLALNNFIEKNNCDNPAFVRELVYGVLKNKKLLDFINKRFVQKGFSRLNPRDMSLLRMGTYQIACMDSVPEYAAVSETVELAKKYAKGRERFINGVLRSVVREKDYIIFPDKEDNPIKYLSIMYSCEQWIVESLVDSLGFNAAESYLISSNETPDLSIRVNTFLTNREVLSEKLKKQGFDVKNSDVSDRGILVTGSGVLSTQEFSEGLFSVQDEASVMAIDIMGAEANETICDICAAPGGKTVSIAELMQNKGKILAFDVYDNKINLINEAAKKNKIDIIEAKVHDGTKFLTELNEKCDRVLCDVPCSGLGVIRRKPEIKYKSAVDIEKLIAKQWSILTNASRYVKKGGILLYTTCTVNPNENERQTDKFIAENKQFKKVFEKTLLPQEGTDGFYICKMLKED